MPIPSSSTLTSTVSSRRRAATRTVPPPGEYLTAFSTRSIRICRSFSRSASAASGSGGRSSTNSWPSSTSDCFAAATTSVTISPTSVGGELDLQVAGVEPGDAEQPVDDRRQPLGLGGDVAEERVALLLAEEHVVAEQRLGEAVDRGQRRAQLVGDVRDELRLHLLDDALGGDVAEGEDAAGHGAGRVAHHGLGQREPDLLAAAPDRDEPFAGRHVLAGLELALQHVARRALERVVPGDAGDALGGRVPEHDLALAVDGDDPVGDVGEDRLAALLLERDALVELGVRERGGGVAGEGRERLDLLLAPGARAAAVDREHAVHARLRGRRAAPPTQAA